MEREFIIIDEALRVISQQVLDLFNRIPEARQIIDFRNLLTHDYSSVSDRIVWGCIQKDLPLLGEHCAHELQDLNQESP